MKENAEGGSAIKKMEGVDETLISQLEQILIERLTRKIEEKVD